MACTGSIGDGDQPIDPLANGDPGRVTIHRLNNAEYNATVRDLLGTSLRPADDFPSDDHSLGFDNIADALNISVVQLELYERAAESLAADALNIGVSSATMRAEAEDVGGSVGSASGSAWNLFSTGEVTLSHTFAQSGQYIVRTRVWQDAAGPDDAQTSITVGATTLGPFDVPNGANSPLVIEQTIEVTASVVPVSVAFLNDFYDAPTMADRNLYVDYIEIEGPIGATAENPLRDRIVSCDFLTLGDPCVREIIGNFAAKAFRRPVETAEVDALMGVFALAAQNGDDREEGLKLAVRAILTSPHFLFRVELDPDPDALDPHPVSDYELASRLSYFLWSSMPDDELFAKAAAGVLSTEEELDAQIERMLADPKAQALVENFAGQWLFTRALTDHQANYLAYPDFDEPLRASMKLEADLFFAELLADESRTLADLLVSDFTYVDARLAAHYQMSGSFTNEPTKVSLSDAERGGILKQGSWLTVTSNPDRTSPVKRGKWILENLLCSAPPPPPAGVEGFKPEDLTGKTQRELLEVHRADPVCASCHAVMDPMGLGFETYDGIGAFRVQDQGQAIETWGDIEGKAFGTTEELVGIIANDPRFASCALEKVFVYALGRGFLGGDKKYVDEIAQNFQADGLRLRGLIKFVVQSDTFRMRRGELPAGGGK